jgi:hypothetical protein
VFRVTVFWARLFWARLFWARLFWARLFWARLFWATVLLVRVLWATGRRALRWGRSQVAQGKHLGSFGIMGLKQA